MAVRLAEIVAGVCLASDLGRGLDDAQGLRSCILGMELAERAGFPAEHRETLYWLSLLRFVGCTTTATEMSRLGDERQVSRAFATADTRDLRDVVRRARTVVGSRPDRVVGFLAKAPAVVAEHETTSCEVARSVAERLGLGEEVRTALGQVFERYDGHGNPGRVGTDLHPATAFWQAVHIADLVAREGADVADELGRRAGRTLAPDAVASVLRVWDDAAVPEVPTVNAVLDREPEPHRSTDDLEPVLEVFALLADGKSPYFTGHSVAVARLAGEAARLAGLAPDVVERVRRAGLVHDVGKVAVSSRVWSASGPLSDAEQEQVRLHPYYTQRVLSRVPALGDLVEPAASHHERADGSGYHRGVRALPAAEAILACADCFVTAGEPRPHRPARTAAEQVARLRGEAAEGRLDPAAVEAVVAAATGAGDATGGGAVVPPSVGALTRREREVLGLVARGLTNQATGRQLGISAKTVNAHLEHAYAKLGVSTRVSAVVEATRRGWLA